MVRSKINRIYRLLLREKSPLVLVWLSPFVVLAPVLFTGKALYWGTPLLQFIPWWTQAWHSLHMGQLPLWNPLLGMGAPLLANYQTALFYPPTWIYFGLAEIGGVPAMAVSTGWLVALHLAWAGWGMSKLTKALGWPLVSQVVSGLAFGLSGYLVSRSHFLSINAAVAWLPWILLAVYQLAMDHKNRGALLRLTLFITMQLLAGHAQTTWYTLLLAGVWLLFWAWQHGGKYNLWPVLWRYLLAGGWAGVLSAAQLLPTAEYLMQSQRATQFTAEHAMSYSFWPWRLLTLLAPNLYGSPAHGDYWGYGAYWEDAIYIGLMGLMLVLLGVIIRSKTDLEKRLVWFLAAVIGISILLALGDNTPVFPWLYQHVPTFDMFQAPARWLLWAEFALALLAGLGAAYWRRPRKRALYWSRLGTMGAFAVSLGAGLAWWLQSQGILQLGEINPTFVPAFTLLGLWGLGAGALNLLAPENNEKPADKRWLWAVCLWLAADLVVAGWGLNPGIEPRQYREMAGKHAMTQVEKPRYHLSLSDEQVLKFDRFFSFETFEIQEGVGAVRDNLLPNANILDDVSMTSNFDPILPARYLQWMESMEQQSAQVNEQMLARMGVDTVMTVSDISPYAVEYQPAAINYGRVRWAGCAIAVEDGELALRTLLDGGVGPDSVVIESDQYEICNPQSSASFLHLSSPNQVSISIGAEQDGFLVLADSWYPGWQATLDGQRTEVLRADYLFRAVFVPAGSHVVKFIYQPLSVYGGLALSAFGWLVMAWVLWRMSFDEA